jgi:hypothetical protein
VVLPGVEYIPLETLRKLEEFVRGGGILIATRRLPGITPGLQATEAEQIQVREIVNRLFEGPTPSAHLVKDEKSELGQTLARLLQPDLQLTPAVPEIGFVHRQTAEAEIYYVANTSNVRRDVNGTFRQQNVQPEWWDPMTGHVSAAEVIAQRQKGLTIRLDLEPYASRILIFSKRRLAVPQRGNVSAVSDKGSTIDLSTDWRVTFEGSSPIVMDHLRSWTDDEATRYFSGTATYEKKFEVTPGLLRGGLRVELDFGEGAALPEQPLRSGMQTWFDPPVREAAVVYLNNQRVGSVWCPPYKLDLTGLLKPGENKLRIVVGNLALNYMAGHRLPDYRLLNLRYGERFQAQDMDKVKPIPSGLFGPIRIIAVENK